MNILPKKRWHVRTKDNIARVRKDEALAAEEEKKKQMRIEKAEREARTEALRKKARELYGARTEAESPRVASSEPESKSHVNLFYELEQNEVVSNKTNKDYEEEKKQEKEKYEKQIGYLTYLGQDTNEMTGEVSWYNKPREELVDKQEVSKKQKTFEDPLEDIRKYLGCEGIKKISDSVKAIQSKKETKELITRKRKSSDSSSKYKKHKKEKKSKHKHKKKKKKHKSKHSSESESESESEESEVEIKKESNVDLERLRAERIRREREERRRANEVFARINGVTIKKENPEPQPLQKYNSQFNPHLAKQNYDNRKLNEQVWYENLDVEPEKAG